MDISQHSVQQFGDRYVCLLCQRASHKAAKNAAAFFASKCTEQTSFYYSHVRKIIGSVQIGAAKTHPSHNLSSYRGLVFCNKCGFYATKVIKGLAIRCTNTPTAHGNNTLEKPKADRFPPGIHEWPELADISSYGSYVFRNVVQQVHQLASQRSYSAPSTDAQLEEELSEPELGLDPVTASAREARANASPSDSD